MRSVMYKSLDRPGFQLQPASGFQVKSKFPNSMNMKHFKLVNDSSFRSALLTLSSGTNTNANRRNANIFHNIKIQTQTQTQMQIQIVGVRTLSTIYEYKHKRKYKYQLQECEHCPQYMNTNTNANTNTNCRSSIIVHQSGRKCGVGSQRTCSHFSALSAYLRNFRQKIPC